jgi:hypothetical protein
MSEFSKKLVEEAWERSGRSCECTDTSHGHQGRCGKNLIKADRNNRFSFSGWEANSKSGQHLESLDDCEILCLDPCYVESLAKKHRIQV